MPGIKYPGDAGADRFDTIAQRIDYVGDFLTGFDPDPRRRAEHEYAGNRRNQRLRARERRSRERKRRKMRRRALDQLAVRQVFDDRLRIVLGMPV